MIIDSAAIKVKAKILFQKERFARNIISKIHKNS